MSGHRVSPQTATPSSGPPPTNPSSRETETQVARVPDGYLGGTSFFASLAESQQSIEGVGSFEREAVMAPKLTFRDDFRIEQGVEVLKILSLVVEDHDTFECRRCNMVSLQGHK